MTVITHSIVIPTKDRPNLLQRAVASARAALGDSGEIIVVDDGSSTPVEMALKLLPNDVLRILRHSTPAGASAARNTGIAHAQGKVIFLLDDDDELMPDYVRSIMSGPAQDYDYGYCCYDKTFAAEGRIRKGKPFFRTGPIPARASLEKKIFATSMGAWVKREVAETIGPFDTALKIGEDTDYSCRLLRHGKRGYYTAEVGIMIHIHNSPSDQAHIGQSRSAAQAADDMLIVATRFPEFALHLGQKYLRLCAYAKLDQQAASFIRRQNSIFLRLWFWAFWGAKRLRHGLKRAKPA